MRKAIKKEGKKVTAYEVGKDIEEIEKLISLGKVKRNEKGKYEIFSKEAISGKGEVVEDGDFIKLDTSGDPYPNAREFFLKNHNHIEGYEYEQIPQKVSIWQADEEMVPEIEFLLSHKGLVINESDEHLYYAAPLWGTTLCASKDAYIVFYRVTREEGIITDIDYNFVGKMEFYRTYNILDGNIEALSL